MSDNWVVQALQSAFEIWNDKLTEIWSLITTTPQEFRGGDIWNAIVGINEGLKAVGYGLLVLFFAMGIFGHAPKVSGLAKAGIRPAPFHPLYGRQGGGELRHGDHDRGFFHLRRHCPVCDERNGRHGCRRCDDTPGDGGRH